MAKKGRPRIEIDKEEFEKLCRFQCTLLEIAGWFHCSQTTIENWCKRNYKTIFSETHKNLSAGGKSSLRRVQYQKALDGNVTMLIWLGKQYLKQRDKGEVDSDETLKKLDILLNRFEGEL